MTISYWMILVVNSGLSIPRKTRPALLALFWLGLVVLFALTGCEKAPNVSQLRLSGATMGTSYHISLIADPSSTDSQALQTDIDQLLADINQSMSTYIPSSEINRLNTLATEQWFDVSVDLMQVLRISHEVSELSSGAFDITVRPLIDLWGFGPEPKHDVVPDSQQISDARALTGYHALILSDDSFKVLLRHPLQIDLSAVAKGFAVDKVAEYLVAQGYQDFLVEIGGELRLSGHNSKDSMWKIAIERPDSVLSSSVFKALELTDVGVATSGDYRNYFELDGVRYSHTIDPRSGYPITHNLVSVTVLDESAARADALATAFSVLGAEQSILLANSQGIPALFIIRDGDAFKELSSTAFQQWPTLN